MKNYILDTNILIYEPEALFLFDEHNLYICPVTIREISGLKEAPGETGYAARKVKRLLDGLRDGGHSLKDGLPLGGDRGVLRVTEGTDFSGFVPGMSRTKADDYILAGAAWLTKNSPLETILVTDDADMALLADIIGVRTEHFRGMRTDARTRYTGRGEVSLTPAVFEYLAQGDPVPLPAGVEAQPNQFFTVHCEERGGGTLLAKADAKGTSLVMLPVKAKERMHPWGISPRNSGQRFAVAALTDPEIPLVILSGPAGTAKTFLTLAAGLEQVMEQHTYDSILITRANVEMDATYGYLPGTEEEKIAPMMRPFLDNLNALTKGKQPEKKDGINCPSVVETLFEQGIIKAEAMQYMRGRSITNTFVIIDEVQNCTPSQVLSIVSRIGEGSKIVLLGDPAQIDNRVLDEYNNGLVYAASRFTGSGLCAQIQMLDTECVRSRLASEAAVRLSLRYGQV